MARVEHRQPRICCRCEQEFTAEQVHGIEGIGWTPLRGGWRCPTCSRTHQQRVDTMAQALVANHERHLWLRSEEHTAYEGCLWCEVIERASTLMLQRPE